MAGASPSEPHTSVTALRTLVCMLVRLLVWTDNLPEILNLRIYGKLYVHVQIANCKFIGHCSRFVVALALST